MKFIKQDENSVDVINLELCGNFYTMDSKVINCEKPFSIVFVIGTTENEFWHYEKESERDLQFKYICEIADVGSIGN